VSDYIQFQIDVHSKLFKFSQPGIILKNVLLETPSHPFEEELLTIFDKADLACYQQIIDRIYSEFEQAHAALTFRENERETLLALVLYFKALSDQSKKSFKVKNQR